MKKIILAILAFFFVSGFMVVDSHADYYRRHHGVYWGGPDVVISPRPYRYYYSTPPVYYARPPVAYYSPPPVVIRQPAPVYYSAPWHPGIGVFLPGINIHVR